VALLPSLKAFKRVPVVAPPAWRPFRHQWCIHERQHCYLQEHPTQQKAHSCSRQTVKVPWKPKLIDQLSSAGGRVAPGETTEKSATEFPW